MKALSKRSVAKIQNKGFVLDILNSKGIVNHYPLQLQWFMAVNGFPFFAVPVDTMGFT